jgi:leader peptidase (prepilin peptidase)/N-methyltransferase
MPAMIELLQQSPPVAIAAASLLGLLIGSFLNVVIYRVPKSCWNGNGRRRPPNSRASPPMPTPLLPPRRTAPSST